MSDLKTILTPERIVIDSDARSKKRILEQISQLCAKGFETELFYQLLIAREKLGSTALGEGIALPHCRIPSLNESIACFIRLDEGIDFDAPDNKPVDLIFGLFVPQAQTSEHLDLLAQLAMFFSQSQFREKIKKATSTQEIYNLFTATP